jgi:hypothetical protein
MLWKQASKLFTAMLDLAFELFDHSYKCAEFKSPKRVA